MDRMNPAVVSALAVALALFVASSVMAQTTGQGGAAEHSQHHPQAPAQAAPSAPAAPGPQPSGRGMMGGGMMGGDMGRMMQMMHGRMGAAGAMMGLHRIEGQLAYARAELKITEAQSAAWSTFADVIRAQHAKLQEAMAKTMAPMMPMGERQQVTAPQQMERRIAALSAQLEAMRSVSAAAQPLYASLTEEQRRIADELMAEHFRSMRMAGM